MPSDVQFISWNIERIVVHEVHLREGSRVPPTYSTNLFQLEGKAKNTFCQRLQDALSNDSKCTKMDIIKTGRESFFSYSKQLLSSTSIEEFINISKNYADLLTDAQTTRSIPGGILIIFTGTISSYRYKFVAAIKAEAQEGFARHTDDWNNIHLKLMDNLFLTPSARMYKIGIFIHNKEDISNISQNNFSAYVYDYLMTKHNRDSSARYFYEGFLGCGFPQDAARLTKKFFDLTKEFISKYLNCSAEQKYLYYSDLQSYMRSASTDIHISTFANTYFKSSEDKDSYNNFMRDNNFTTNSIMKDTSDISDKLKFRKISFPSQIKLSGPIDKMNSLVEIEKIKGPENNNGISPEWTKIIIKDRLKDTDS